MTRLSVYLDRTIDAGLVFVLVFTPLAFGGVEGWARSIGQLAILVVISAWLLKLTWTSAPRTPPPRSVLGGRILLSGLELPALLFVALVLLQLLPLSPAVTGVVSPATKAIFTESLPGYGEEGQPSFADLPRWLQADPAAEAGGVPALPPDPEATAAALPAELFDVPHPGWRPLSLTPGHTRRALGVFLAHLAVFVVAFNHLGNGARLRRYLYLLSGMAGLLSVLGILQSLSAEDKLYWWRGSGDHYSFGPFVNHSNFAGWMEMVLPLCAGLALMAWARQRHDVISPRSLVEQLGRPYAAVVLLGFTTVVGLAAFVLAKSRGGFVALSGAFGLLFLLYLATGRLRWKAVAAGGLALGAALALAVWIDGSGLWERYRTLGDVEQEKSFQSRLSYSKQALAMAVDFPVLGTGFGTFREAHYLYSPGTSARELVRAHNDYAQLAAECGLLGAVAMGWALVLLLARGVVPVLLRGRGPDRWPVRGIALGILALLIHSFFDFNLQIYSNGILFVFLCALLLRDAREVTARERARGTA